MQDKHTGSWVVVDRHMLKHSRIVVSFEMLLPGKSNVYILLII